MNLFEIYEEIKDIKLPDGWIFEHDTKENNIKFKAYSDKLAVYLIWVDIKYSLKLSGDGNYYLECYDNSTSLIPKVELKRLDVVKRYVEYYIHCYDEYRKYYKTFMNHKDRIFRNINDIDSKSREYRLNKIL